MEEGLILREGLGVLFLVSDFFKNPTLDSLGSRGRIRVQVWLANTLRLIDTEGDETLP